MKIKIRILLFGLSLAVFSGNVFAQAILTTDDGPVSADPSAMLEISSTNRGFLMPVISLTYVEGKIAAPSISATPADGLIIYNNAVSVGISKGFWYYDAELDGGTWVFYSDLSSVQSEQSLDDFAEMYEVEDYGNGTLYELSQDYFIPWSSGEPGLKGLAFDFIDSETVTVSPGIDVEADRYEINTQVAAIYSAVVSTTIASTTPSNTVTGQLFINDVKVDNIFFRNTFQLKNKPTSLNTSGNIQLEPGDKVDFRFKSSDKNNGIKVEYVNIRLTKLGEI